MARHFHLLPFAEESEFVWTRPGVSNGVPVETGSPVDKSIFTPTRLRQLYEARRIQPAPFGAAKPPGFLNNGKGKADKLAAEIAAEEAAALKAKGESDAQSRPAPSPTPANRVRAAKPAPARAQKPKPAAAPKSKRQRAAA